MRKFLVIMAALLIAVMPLTAYADDQGASAPDGTVPTPTVDNSTPADSEPEEGNEEEGEEEEVAEQLEEPETDEGEPEKIPVEEDPDKEPSDEITGDTSDVPEDVPEEEPSRSKYELARERLLQASAGDEVYLEDLGISVFEVEEMLVGTPFMGDFAVIQDENGNVILIYLGDLSDDDLEGVVDVTVEASAEPEIGEAATEEPVFAEPETATLLFDLEEDVLSEESLLTDAFREPEDSGEDTPAAPAVPVNDPLEGDHAATDIPELMLTLSVGIAGLIKAISSII